MLISPKQFGEIQQEESSAIVTLADGTDEEITAMITAADQGDINLSDYWAVGDTRSVDIASFNGNYNYHLAQTAELVLMQEGLYQTIDDKTVNFVVGFKDAFERLERMNRRDTNSGSWRDCTMRTLCNGNLYNAFPQWLRSIIKTVEVTTGDYNGERHPGGYNITTEDKVFLAAVKEIQGGTSSASSPSLSATGREVNALTQFDYYKTSANRIKKQGSNGSALDWWSRSPYNKKNSSFCYITSAGYSGQQSASTGSGLVPHFCI